MFQTLLLNATYECIAFISERKLFKLLAKDKVEVLENWNEKVVFGRGRQIHVPAVIRLKHHVRWIPRKVRFNRMAVFRRDNFTCQYCNKITNIAKLTLDHVLPRTRGGDNSWKNCVTACFTCNNNKSNRTPEEAGMPLLKKPFVPQLSIANDYAVIGQKHESWKSYLPNS